MRMVTQHRVRVLVLVLRKRNSEFWMMNWRGKAAATLICCADEAAVCASCDVEIHAANKLASKHQRLLLECLPNKLPRCDICQAAFIFCIEDRALFCRECDENIHIPNTLNGTHQRHLATGIRVGLNSISTINDLDQPANNFEPPMSNIKVPLTENKPMTAPHAASSFVPSWPVEDFLQLSDYESSDKYQKGSPLGLRELDWFSDIGVLQEQQIPTKGSLAEVPEFHGPHSQSSNNHSNYSSSLYKPFKSASSMPFKKPRIEICSDDEEFFFVPDLG